MRQPHFYLQFPPGAITSTLQDVQFETFVGYTCPVDHLVLHQILGSALQIGLRTNNKFCRILEMSSFSVEVRAFHFSRKAFWFAHGGTAHLIDEKILRFRITMFTIIPIMGTQFWKKLIRVKRFKQ